MYNKIKAMNDAGVCVLRAEMYGHGKSGGRFHDHTLYKWITNFLKMLGKAYAALMNSGMR